ncbi:hypothetical protein GCM10023186_06780 [Hymenobacter koreensis]|uniref:PA14 domain-containing protein n=1 Tax=Hymenobacter koreensis TaxID=1084523 RepID=A0ABP8IUZ8_9BACT
MADAAPVVSLLPVEARLSRVAAGVSVAKLPVQTPGNGLSGSYFTNGSLAGAPALRRVDAAIDFQWGQGAPAAGLPADNFSVRWEGQLAAPSTGSYRFIAQSGDEVRLWINGKKVLDTWQGSKGGFVAGGSVGLAAGEKTSIRLEYTDAEGDAQLQLMWVPPGQAAQLIPTTYLFPLGAPATPAPVAAATPAPTPAPAAPAPVAPATPTPAEPAKAVAATPQPAAPKPEPRKKTPKPATPKPEQAKAVAAKPAEPTSVAAQPAPVAQPAPATPTPAPAATEPETAQAAVEEAPGKPVELPAESQAAVYILTSRSSRKPLEVVDPSRPNSRAYQPVVGAAPVKTARNAAPQWRIESIGNGFYRLVVPGNNKVLEVLGSATNNGAPLNLWTYYSGNNQVWRIEPAEHGYFKLVAKHSKKALTDKDSIEGGLQQWRYNGNANQQWKLEAVQEEELPPLAASVGRPGLGLHKMSLYPNPSNGVVQLSYQLPEPTPVGWVLYDQRGSAVRVSDYRRRPAGGHHQTLEFTGLPAGDYYLHLTVGTATTKQSLFIRKPAAEAAAPATTTSN